MSKLQLCYYCGLPATGVDHVIPQAILKALADVEMVFDPHRILLVPCCPECNSLLECSIQDTLLQRKRLLRIRLRNKYKSILELPNWNSNQLETMDYNMLTYIRAGIELKNLVIRRLKWLGTKAGRELNNEQSVLNVEGPSINIPLGKNSVRTSVESQLITPKEKEIRSCLFCREQFKVRTSWMTYCSLTCRARAYKIRKDWKMDDTSLSSAELKTRLDTVELALAKVRKSYDWTAGSNATPTQLEQPHA